MRTTLEIEDTDVEAIMNRYRVRTKTEAVDLALRHLPPPTTREEALTVRGANAVAEPPADVHLVLRDPRYLAAGSGKADASQVAMSAMTAGSRCWAGSYSAGEDGPLPGTNRWLSAS